MVTVTPKPWGFEYPIYENTNLAIWLLRIEPHGKTSFHSHPKKTTGLYVLEGRVIVDFLKDCKILESLSKTMIRKGLFHSTEAISKDGAYILEVEYPSDKNDLVRLKDDYGRKGLPYEKETLEKDFVKISEINTEYKFRNLKFVLKKIETIDQLKHENPIIFVNGGISTDYGVQVTSVGDIIDRNVLNILMKEFPHLTENTIILTIEKE